MPYFDRFDIVEAHLTLEYAWHSGGILWERPSNRRRNMSTEFQTSRRPIRFRPSPMFGSFEHLSDNAKEIYADLCRNYKFVDPDVVAWERDLDQAAEEFDASLDG